MDKFNKFIEHIRPNIHGNILLNEPLANHTTFRIGGVSKALIWVESEQDILFIHEEMLKKKVFLK